MRRAQPGRRHVATCSSSICLLYAGGRKKGGRERGREKKISALVERIPIVIFILTQTTKEEKGKRERGKMMQPTTFLLPSSRCRISRGGGKKKKEKEGEAFPISALFLSFPWGKEGGKLIMFSL